MISVVIPTLNEELRLPATLGALVGGAVDGLVREVIIADGGSIDATRVIAEAMGATVVQTGANRGAQIAAGVAATRAPWVLILHADTVLAHGWIADAERFIEAQARTGARAKAAAFRFALDDATSAARMVERGVALRCWALKLPYGDQGLLIPRTLYDAIGGMRALPLMEDVDLIRRLGRSRLSFLPAHAVTSADRYRRDGYFARVSRNFVCVAGFALGVPVERIARFYAGAKTPK